MTHDRPIGKLPGQRSELYLYADRLIERRDWPFTDRVHLLGPGMTARIDDVALRIGTTHSDRRYLTITGPGLVLTRMLRGSDSITLGMRFAERLNAAVDALGDREARP